MHTPIYSVFPPPDTLKNDVDCIRVVKLSNDRRLDVKTCPNGSPGMVFHYSDGKPVIEKIAIRSGTATDIPPLFLYGQGSEPSIMSFRKGVSSNIQVAMKPQALYTIFHMDASSITKGFLDAPEFGASDLLATLIAAQNDAERVTFIWQFLVDRLNQESTRDLLVEKGLALIRGHIDTITVKDLVERLDISERQLQKRFLKVIGSTPQSYIRIKRVNEALRMINSGEYQKLSDVAFALNYYDQSHFIHDIKDLSWVTPKYITQNTSDIRQDQSGFSYL